MTYALGLDLGTTYTAAAIWRNGSAEMVGLGTHGAAIPSIVHLRADGQLLTGEAAVRRSLKEAGNSAREFKRRLGDPTPIVLGGTPYDAAELMKALLRDVVATVVEREGEAPAVVAIAHPANWGEFKIDLLRQAAISCGLHNVWMVSEPAAAAVHYASKEGLAIGETVAVYDLGGGTFDVAVLQRTEDGFRTLGQPEGLERLGGIDFDHAVMAHVERSLVDEMADLDRSDPEVIAALARLRQECIAAKEGLSEDGEISVPVALPGIWTDVRITRAEFESMIGPTLAEPLRAFNRALTSAQVSPEHIHAVLLVGGSSRIPLVAETVAGALKRKVALDTHPKHAVALGAAQVVGSSLETANQPEVQVPEDPATSTAPAAVAEAAVAAPPGQRQQRDTRLLVAALVATLAIVAIAIAAMLGGATTTGSASEFTLAPTAVAGSDLLVEPTVEREVPAFEPTSEPTDAPLAGVNSSPTVVGGGSRPPAVPTAAPTALPTPVPTPSQPACPSASGLCALITDIQIIDGRYVAQYATVGFTPLVVGEDAGSVAGDHHVHFFFDTTSPQNAGTNGNPPGTWALWSLQRGGGRFVFDGFSPPQRGSADQLCVVVATDRHGVLADSASTGNCVALPV